MAQIPLTITGATAPYNISVKKQGDNTERFVSYNGTNLTYNGTLESNLVTYTIYLTDANQCPAQVNFTQSCGGIQCNIPYDIVILIDESSSITSSDFLINQLGVETLLNKLKPHMQSQVIKVGIVLFGSRNDCVRIVSSLNYDTQGLINAMYSYPQGGALTPTARGLEISHRVVIGTWPGTEGTARSNVNKKIILITDGQPTQNVDCGIGSDAEAIQQATQVANNIKNAVDQGGYRTKIITVGVGTGANNDYLKNSIASDQNNFPVTSYQQFVQIADQLAEEICK